MGRTMPHPKTYPKTNRTIQKVRRTASTQPPLLHPETFCLAALDIRKSFAHRGVACLDKLNDIAYDSGGHAHTRRAKEERRICMPNARILGGWRDTKDFSVA